MVGSSLWRELTSQGFQNLIGYSSKELDLREKRETISAIRNARPDIIIVAAAHVGGIIANRDAPVDFLNDNLEIQSNLFQAAHNANVQRLLFLGSSCIYPRLAQQPIREDSLLTGPLEESNEAYAIAKITGIKQVQSYRKQYGHSWISAMPTNLYGPGDNFDLGTSHVVPAMIRKFYEASMRRDSQVTMWGSGSPRRDLLHVDDLARACVSLLRRYNTPVPINVGSGHELSIRELAELISEVAEFRGEIVWDSAMPDGTPRKLLDNDRISALGWKPKIDLKDGIGRVFSAYAKMFPNIER